MTVLDNGVNKKILESFELSGNIMLTGASGNEVEVLVGMLNNVRTGEREFRPMQAIITELVDLENVYAGKVDGMLGFGYFAQGICSFNFIKKEMTMYFYK